MSHVARVELHIYQGEDWALGIEMSGDDAPEDFDDDAFFFELRKHAGAEVLHRLTVGDGISVTLGSPEALIELGAEDTRELSPGGYEADLFWEQSGGGTTPLFRASVTVTERITVAEEGA